LSLAERLENGVGWIVGHLSDDTHVQFDITETSSACARAHARTGSKNKTINWKLLYSIRPKITKC
jgi:hypothetical protein